MRQLSRTPQLSRPPLSGSQEAFLKTIILLSRPPLSLDTKTDSEHKVTKTGALEFESELAIVHQDLSTENLYLKI